MIDDLVKIIDDTSRDRVYLMSLRIPVLGRLGARLRGRLGWKKELPKSERTVIEERALSLIAYGRKVRTWEAKEHARARAIEANEEARARAKERKEKLPRKLKLSEPQPLPEPDPIFVSVQHYLSLTLEGVEPIEQEEDVVTTKLEGLADQLPVAPWWKENVFKSTLMLGWLIAEAGDLSKYPGLFHKGHPRAGLPRPAHHGPGCLYKRLGVAVMRVVKDGVEVGRVRQGAPGHDATKQDWIDHGYVERRRSILSVLGDCLIKQNPHYKAIYDRRKAYLQNRAEAKGLKIISAEKKKKVPEGCITKDHIHNDAQRYMEKRLLRDLWRAWRRASAGVPDRANQELPAASLSQAAE